MHISDVEAYRRDKDHLMRNEGAHPANRLPERRFKSATESQAEELVKDAAKEGLHMEIE